MDLRSISTGEELAALLGVNYRKQVIFYTYRHPQPYTAFQVPKRSGRGERTIKAPIPPLAYIQSKLRDHLDALYNVRVCVHGFVKGRDIVTNAEAHRARRYVLNVDISDFFGSIHHGRIAGALRGLGVAPAVAKLISHICTHDGTLPQGAPTSPVLSNIVCWSLDRTLLALAKQTRSQYTRYADDITFSTFQKAFPSALAQYVEVDGVKNLAVGSDLEQAVADAGFSLNPQKTRLLSRDGRQEVTGLVVNEKVNVPRTYIRDVRAALYVWATKGKATAQQIFLDRYAKSEGRSRGSANIEDHLRGKISHLRKVKGEFDSAYITLRDKFNLLSDKKISINADRGSDWIGLLTRAIWVIQTVGESNPNESSQGTAFFLEGVGLVTCDHCISDKHAMIAFNPQMPAKRFPISRKSGNAVVDLAILEHSIPPDQFLEIRGVSPEPLKHGAAITLAGWPDFGPGDDITLRPGVVIGFKTKSSIRRIRLNLPVIYGNSGGPAFDADGLVVGVAVTGAGSLADAEQAKDNSLVPIAALAHILDDGWPAAN